MVAITNKVAGMVSVTKEDITPMVQDSISKTEVEHAMASLLVMPSEQEITTKTGQRFRADSVIVDEDNNIVIARNVYPLASLANSRFYLNQTTAATDNKIIYTSAGTNSTIAFTDYSPAGFMEELKFNFNTWPTTSIGIGMPTYYGVSARSKREQLQAKIRSQMQPNLTKLFGHRPRSESKSFRNTKDNELVALGLLKSMLTPDVWKKYLTHHFVTVSGPSGLTYQIKRASHNIIVWDRGTKVSNLCVYIQDSSIPPTDEVVAKMLICMYDESDIWKRANVTWQVANGDRLFKITEQLDIPLPTTRSAFGLGNRLNANIPRVVHGRMVA